MRVLEKNIHKAVCNWGIVKGFQVTCVEAKGIWNPSMQRYIPGRTKAGTSDILMCDTSGRFLAIEVKAPGKKKTLSEAQEQYLHEVIMRHGFGVCVDNVKELDEVYAQWCRCADVDKKSILLDRLGLF